MISACKSRLNREVLQDAFVFTCDRMRRYEGAWHLERGLLFPGYVFLESGNGEQLLWELKQHTEMCWMLENNGSQLKAVEPEEERFLQSLCGTAHHSGMSRGYIYNGRTFVTEGPLQGKESLIRKIDRHKRIARVGLDPENRAGRNSSGQSGGSCTGFQELQVGLEIVTKC